MKRFIRKGVLAMVILIWVLTGVESIIAQKTVAMYLIDQGWSGDTNYVELRCNRFQDVSSMHFSIREQNLKGSFHSIDQISIPNFQAVSNYTFDGSALHINWTSPIIGYNNPDGQLVFRIKWISNQLSNPCLEIFNNPEVIKIKNSVFETHPVDGHTSCESLIAIPSFFNAFIDANLNCVFEQEQLFTDYTIIDSFNQNVHIYKNPQSLIYGKADYGRHHFIIIPEYPVWTSCNKEQTIDIDSSTKIISLNYGIQPLISCPQLVAEIYSPIVRRCVDFKYFVNYLNGGTIAEDSAKIRIKLDPYMSFVGASIPVANIQLPFVEFDLGKLDVYQKGSFNFTVNIDCNSTIVGQTHCVSAEILPHRDCFKSPLWSGASIDLDVKCENDKAKFRIENTGAENMQEAIQYWIVEDDIMPGLKKDIKLDKGQFYDLEYPGNGKTYRLITNQVENHPGHSNPTVALEACGKDNSGNFSTGYLLMFAEDEEDFDIAIDCQASRASFDPNDKTGLPIGYGPERFIEPQRSLEYKIRFQNLGNDTAFKVIIVDTLSEWMDLKTLRVLNASHEFSFNLVDRVLSFRFDPIYLPYQSIDDEGSNGFVTYSIQPKKETPLKTRIFNDAEIYFDFNSPIKTNTTIHTLATDFIIVDVEPADPYNTNVNIYPNPGTYFLMIESEMMSQEKDVVIYDAYGHPAISQKLNGKICKADLQNLKPGIYLVKIRDKQGLSFSQKIIVRTKN